MYVCGVVGVLVVVVVIVVSGSRMKMSFFCGLGMVFFVCVVIEWVCGYFVFGFICCRLW